jgi:hypothetical protein
MTKVPMGDGRRIATLALVAGAAIFLAVGLICAWASVELLELRSLLDEIVCLVCHEEVRLLGYPFTWPLAPIAAVLCVALAAAAAVTAWLARTRHGGVLHTGPDGVDPQRPS